MLFLSSDTQEVIVSGGYNRDIGTGTGNLNINGEYGHYMDSCGKWG